MMDCQSMKSLSVMPFEFIHAEVLAQSNAVDVSLKRTEMRKIILGFISLFMLCSCASGIHRAVKNQKMAEIKRYVSEGRVNQRQGSLDQTPLMIAALYGYDDIAGYLCDHGADIDARAKDGSTALIYAAIYNQAGVARILLVHGCSIVLKDNGGYTAYYYAMYYRHYRIADMIEDKGFKDQTIHCD